MQWVDERLPDTFCANNFALLGPHTGAVCRQYLDLDTAGKWQARQRGADVRIWFSAMIEICEPTLWITHTLGGQDFGDTPLVMALAHTTELRLEHWEIGYGGDGYTCGVVAQGFDNPSLAAYLSDTANSL